MEEKRKTNQVTWMGAAQYLKYTTRTEDESRRAGRNLHSRSRGLTAMDVSRATRLACPRMAKETRVF